MSALDDLCSALTKTVGENDKEQSVTKFIDTGFPPLNKIISGRYDGGLPYGRIVDTYAPSSSGKTSLATQWMVETQRLGGIAVFIDWERSFDVELAKGFGLNTAAPYWIYKRPETWEQGNILAIKVCKTVREARDEDGNPVISPDAPILCVFDSVASAVPQSMIDKEMDEYSMNDTTALARVASTTLKSMAQHAAHFNATFLYLNQVRTKPGIAYGDNTTCPGGSALEFYATVRMQLSRKKIMEQKTGGKSFVGQTITVKCTKSKLTKPFEECSLDMVYDDFGVARFDAVGSTIQHLVDIKKIETSGPRIVWNGMKYFKKELVTKINAEGGMKVLKPLLTD